MTVPPNPGWARPSASRRVAIAAVNVLEWFMDIERHADNIKLAWVVGILLAFATAMLILAIADRVSSTDNSSDR